MPVGEWDQRQLCSDGACVGVIGPDGTCKVCGRAAANWGDERKRGLIDPPDDGDDDEDDAALAIAEDAEGDGDDDDEADDEDEEEDDADADDDDEDDAAGDRAAVASSGNEWGTRQLCRDGGCIGVIGPQGRCKVCGRRADDVPDVEALPVAPAAATTGDPDGHSNVS
jgi:hypothetical protein